MNKQNSVLGRKVAAFIASFAFIASVTGVSVVLAAITFSGTSITGDSSFNSIVGATSTTWDLGTGGGTLSLQTTNNGPITAGNGLFTVGGQLNASNIDRSVAGTMTIGNTTSTSITIGRSGQTVFFPGNASTTALLVTGNATTTNLSITAFSSGGCLSASAGGVIATSTCGGSGTVTTSTAISANNFPFWGTATGALAGTSTLSISGTTLTQAGNLLFSAGSAIDSSAAGTLLIGNTTSTSITIGRSGQTVFFPGNASTTGTATFLSALTQSGGTASLATTTVGGSLTINSGTPILKHLSATSSITFGAINAFACNTGTVAVTNAAAGDITAATPLPVASGIDTVSSTWNAWVSGAGTVTIRACNGTATTTAAVAAQTWRADIWQH